MRCCSYHQGFIVLVMFPVANLFRKMNLDYKKELFAGILQFHCILRAPTFALVKVN